MSVQKIIHHTGISSRVCKMFVTSTPEYLRRNSSSLFGHGKGKKCFSLKRGGPKKNFGKLFLEAEKNKKKERQVWPERTFLKELFLKQKKEVRQATWPWQVQGF